MTEKNGLIRRDTAIITQQLLGAPVVQLMADAVPIGAGMYSFDPTDPINEDLIYLVDAPASREWSQHTESAFVVRHWAAKRIELSDPQTGEVQPHVRLVLVDSQGDTLAFVSIGALLSMDVMRTCRGDGPYDPGVPITVQSVKTRAGFHILKFRPAKRSILHPTPKK